MINIENQSNDFNKLVKQKNIGLIIMISSIIPLGLFYGIIGFVLCAFMFGIGIIYLSKYKCPNCEYKLDPRIKSSELIYCPKCGKKLQ